MTNKEEKHCEKCSYENDEGLAESGWSYCECHQNTTKETNNEWEKRFEEAHGIGALHSCESVVESERQRLKEKTQKIKERFRCAACDSAKCEHTQCCQALSEIITF